MLDPLPYEISDQESDGTASESSADKTIYRVLIVDLRSTSTPLLP